MAAKDPEGTSSKGQSTDSPSKKRKQALTEIEVDLSLPEPPSKKARRLLKKGKTLPGKPKTNDEPEKDDEAKETKDTDDTEKKKKKKKKERSPYGVWIGNLRFSVTKPELRKWLVDNSGGSITDDLITRVHMPTTKQPSGGPGPKKAPENRGFAYVDFSTFEASVAAIALSETELQGRKLLIKDSKNFEGRPKKDEADGKTGQGAASAAASKSSSTKIFVGNLSFNTTEDDLYAHFEKCGKIRWVKVATFEDSGKCKGYGWVNFEDAEAAAWAVKGFVKIREPIETLEDFVDENKEAPENPADDEAGANGEQEVESESSGETNDDSQSSEESEEESSGESDGESDEEEEEKTARKKKEDGKKAVIGKKEEQETKTKAKAQKTTSAAKEPTRFRTRKWWVNQLLGRNLKIELAEDDQTRYHKRFGKGAAKRKQQQQQGDKRKSGQGGGKEGGGGGGGENAHKGAGEPKKEVKDINYQTDIGVARLTGAAVAHQGKKITFD
ncbi:hypothetical protein VTH06DRAFT_5201 [Thermothelomyces fergusii]